jgi:hypothetical protein
VAFDATTSGQFITGTNANGVNNKVGGVYFPVLELESTEDLLAVDGTGKLTCWRAACEDFDTHPFDLVKHHLPRLSIKLTREREPLTVDNAHMSNPFRNRIGQRPQRKKEEENSTYDGRS